ncbi:hypothetical protein H5410_037257 [Solanum commersonii]|uniref:Uncharacterized protein n=1 Tax=Solanum commersonii TaxID=4109 RepID=A0A9J5Y6L5_SOLCO|nr:hypothetical protein H5410_037257 [Solanum commersonii]
MEGILLPPGALVTFVQKGIRYLELETKWSNEAKIIKICNGDGGIFEVCWGKEGNNVATSFANNKACVFDIRLWRLRNSFKRT